jgi:hypothetical protein
MHSLNQKALGRAVAAERVEAAKRRAKSARANHSPPKPAAYTTVRFVRRQNRGRPGRAAA